MIKPKISIGALGGTICMSSNGNNNGAIPTFGADDLVNVIPSLKQIAQIHAKTILSLPSGSLKIKHLLEIFKWAKEQIKSGANGVIITQGTDTIEESAFFLNLIWDEEIPLIITGAMRNPDNISPDGAGNIYASVLTALSEESKNRGVLVVLNDTIHSAKWVHKSNTFSIQTFISINAGIQGVVVENCVKYITHAGNRKIYKFNDSIFPKIEIITSCIDNDARTIRLLTDAKFDGIIINGVGAGHVSYDMSDIIKDINLPIVIASRAETGICATKTYGYKGSEIDLINQGCIMSGWLSAIKARLLLMVLISNKMDLKEIKDEFENFNNLI
ncbi:anthranilate synthase component II [Campylobacter sputorum subsp. bubulus]|uniref:L-asparagine amidohydrolase n=1 Tax=Campylobacter sputorum subsp. sputorum TaxID=32024 RepID=A0A381DGQ4_9BACT|nr:asparaginase [Campylobacter sputorum]ASM34956.1 L-asparaginase, type II [Campylobacter sputorum aubsp. sputorum RM3237]KAB0581915.1 asparaginase [Campylobacter sputorum subsp. sputorum]QEL05147.1 L-asparaginase, type II [Campylobacter sputorum subsp. sputorum]SUX09488.1 anthranilate synthase component II [Campylobacter sputorum subsp. sputorum]SUX30785.1 anthranilate synthase component II [Campylobacter sputorum subsp. bubulus]